jgi:hypothetical protein
MAEETTKSGMRRDPPTPSDKRTALVTELTAAVREAKAHWERPFAQMISDMDFAFGRQWSDDDADDRYKANITLRHLQTRTASIYAKNPTVVAKRRERIDYLAWDGQPHTIIAAQEQMKQFQMALQQFQMAEQQYGAQVQQAAVEGMHPGLVPPPVAPVPPDEGVIAVLEDYASVMDRRKMLDRVAKTLELAYTYYQDEQSTNFKLQMKRLVKRVLTCKVGYVELGFQRILDKDPDRQRQIADMQQQIDSIGRLMADIQDGEATEDSAEMERLEASLAALQAQEQVILREGLTFEFPTSFSVIPDMNCTALPGFEGCDWVCRQYLLSPNQIKELYDVDIGANYKSVEHDTDDLSVDGARRDRAYMGKSTTFDRSTEGTLNGDERTALLWRIYHKTDGVVYTIVDGYGDFVEEPAAPPVQLERFYPWFPLIFNDVEHESEIYPPSDVELIRDAQMEYNRAREGLKEHRIAARPKTFVAGGLLTREDRGKLQDHPANAVIELDGLGEGQQIEHVLQAYAGPGIDPNLYEVSPAFVDIQRSVGSSEANLGGTGGGTATENAIAEGSRLSALESNVDDLDTLLSDVAREGGQILLQMLDEGTAKVIVGIGAVLPQMDRERVMQEVYLSVEAGSTGRPNKVQDVANFERLAPILQAIPGLSPAWLFKQLVEVMGTQVDISEAFDEVRPSISAQNAIDIAQATAGLGGQPPQGQTTVADNEPSRMGAAGGQNFEVNRSEAPIPSAPTGRPPMEPVNPRVQAGNA